jgi:hypothetical protein
MTTPTKIADSGRTLENLIAKQDELKSESAILNGVRAFMDHEDGPEKAIGEVLVEIRKDFFAHPGKLANRRQCAALLMSAAEAFDARNHATLNLDDDAIKDMKAQTTLLAVELLESDPYFRKKCLQEVLRRNPGLEAEYINVLQEDESDV